jgi:phosphatidate cytidylyltransferase
MRERAISAAVLVPVLLLVLAIGGPVLAVAIALATAVAAVEVFRLLKAAGYPPLPALGTALAVVVVLDAAFPEVLEGSGLLLGAIGIVLVAVAAFTRPDPHDGVAAWVATTFGALYVSLLSFVLRLGHAAPDIPADAPVAWIGAERGWILLLVLAVWSYDTGAYLVGRRFGQTRFLTHLSPSKTIEGLVGGVVATTTVVGLLLWAVGQPVLHALALGPLVALSAQVGDFAESMIKRAAGASDSGTLIPGHGGILDRVDSFLFAAPVMTLYVIVVISG